ncbi:MAG: NAD(P)-dependent oxidoreductase [candidate division WOR-3 bacterium]
MSSIMVTGGSGFLGSYVARALAERGDDVIIYDNVYLIEERKWLLKPYENKIKIVEGSIIDMPTILNAIKNYKINKIVHLAAIFRPWVEIHQPYLSFKIQEEGTINILEAARLLNVKRVVYASTVGVYGTEHAGPKYEPVDEQHPTECWYLGPYAVSKRCSELWGLNYFFHNSVSFVALRFEAIYGFSMRDPLGLLKPMVENAARGIAKEYNENDIPPKVLPHYVKVTYTYVKDACLGILLALDAKDEKLKSRIYNITGKEQVTLSNLAKIVEEVSGVSVKLAKSLMDAENIFKGRPARSIETAKREIGFMPRYDIRKGVEEYIQTYKEYYKIKIK